MKNNKNNLFVSSKLNKEMANYDKKHNIANIFQYVFLLAVIYFVSTSLIGFKDYLIAGSIKKEMESYNIATEFSNDEEVNAENTQTNSELEVKKVSTAKKKGSLINFNKYDDNVVGSIYIPTVGVNGVIRKGIDYGTLEKYVGLYENGVMPGEAGNLALFAHNNTYVEIFRNLHNVSNGDKIEITTKTGKYTYKVTSKTTVKPTDLSVLDDSNEKEITLITCNSDGTHRVVVKGILI